MEPKKSAFNVALKYAIIFALVSFIWSIIVYALHWYLISWINWIGLIFLLLGLVFVIRERRDKDLGGYITFGQAFGVGFLFCLILGVLGIVTTLLMTQVIAPDMMSEIQKMQEQQMINKGMSDDQVQMAMKYAKMFTTPMALAIFSIVVTAFFGAICSLIVAAIMKKESAQLQQP